jgi:cytochrome c oxidase subunit II
MSPREHARRILIIWIALSIVGMLALWFGLGPHMPPGNVSNQAADQTETNKVIGLIMVPIALGVITFFVYAMFAFRAGEDMAADGPPHKGDARLARAWIITSLTIVLALAIYGTFELLRADQGIAGSGGGQGSSLIASEPKNALDVQVIGQQWHFTYRYPQYGNVETFRLAIPVGRPVIFHVTSIDVIHSFWAYQLGVKADAVPGAVNLVGAQARHTGTFDIRCAELCGVWHGHMYAKGMILSSGGFASWISQQQAQNPFKPNQLPYGQVYYPDPNRRAG